MSLLTSAACRRATLATAAFALVTVAPSSPASHAAPASLRVDVRSILIRAIVSQTAIYGHGLVWTQTVPPEHGNVAPESLYWSGLTRVVRHRIFTFPSGTTALNLEVSRDWIVADLSGSRGASIWAFNRNTHRPRTIAARSPASRSTLPQLALSGDTLVYMVDRLGNDSSGLIEVHVAHLPNGPRQVILRRRLACGTLAVPSISPPAWVGTLPYDCRGNDVFQMDPAGGQISPLTTNHHSLDASTNGTDAVWLQYRAAAGSSGFPTGRVVLDSLDTGRRRVISTSGPGWPAVCRTGSGGTQDQCSQFPGTTSNLVYWINGLGNPAVYDLARASAQVIQAPQPPGVSGFGQGYGRYLTWASQDTKPIPNRPRSWIVIAYVRDYLP